MNQNDLLQNLFVILFPTPCKGGMCQREGGGRVAISSIVSLGRSAVIGSEGGRLCCVE